METISIYSVSVIFLNHVVQLSDISDGLILKDGDDMEPSAYTPILAARIGNINFDSLFTHEQKFSQISVQVLFYMLVDLLRACHLLFFSCFRGL